MPSVVESSVAVSCETAAFSFSSVLRRRASSSSGAARPGWGRPELKAVVLGSRLFHSTPDGGGTPYRAVLRSGSGQLARPHLLHPRRRREAVGARIGPEHAEGRMVGNLPTKQLARLHEAMQHRQRTHFGRGHATDDVLGPQLVGVVEA